MSGSLSLGWRNIWRNRRRTVISMVAIGVGLLLVIFYSGMVGGMLGEAKNQLDNGGLGHVEVFAKDYRPRRDVTRAMAGDSEWRSKLSLPAGAEAGTRVLARGLATSARGNEPVQVFGVEWSQEPGCRRTCASSRKARCRVTRVAWSSVNNSPSGSGSRSARRCG